METPLAYSPVAQELTKLPQEDQDLILAYLFLNYSELERFSGVPRIRWKARMDEIRLKLQDAVCTRAGKVSNEMIRVYSELVKQIEKDQGLEHKEMLHDHDAILRISNFFQRPQPSLQELAVNLECYNPPGRGALYETYTEEGLRVRIKSLPGEIRIILDPERLAALEPAKYSLAFDYKSNDISELKVRLYGPSDAGNLKALSTHQVSNLSRGFWKEVIIPNIPAKLVQVHIIPEREGILHITRMRLVAPAKD